MFFKKKNIKTIFFQMFKLLTGDLEIRGGWGQGLTEHYDPKHWDDKQLHVIIMPHSHCDPGNVRKHG